MARAIAARLKRLETRNSPPARVRHTVLTFDARTGAIIGPKPKGKFMVVPHFGTDDEWSERLQAQQARLIESAHIEGMAQ
tara:strand:- start:1255 stop:1494 length:240 start_codon:yes stop_codon:yes gene_type:complete